jgi:hypothetical protein
LKNEKQEHAMTALRKILTEQETVVTTNVTRAPVAKLYVVKGNAPAEAEAAPEAARRGTLTNIALFLASPFIGLAYIVALPVVGLGFLAVLAVRAATKYEAVKTVARAVRNVAMIIGAPVLGLAYVVLFPFVGLAALAYVAGRAVVARAA